MSGILIADDDPMLVEDLMEYLQFEEYQVHCAYSGIEALGVFQKSLPDCIVLDVRMPGLNGFEVCRQIRQTSSVPIILISALDHEIARIVGFEAGADLFISKPFQFPELMARMKSLERRQHQAHRDSPASMAPP